MTVEWLAGRAISAAGVRRAAENTKAGQYRTTNSGQISTTETVVLTAAAELLADSVYVVRGVVSLAGNTANDIYTLRIRETSVAGTLRREARGIIEFTSDTNPSTFREVAYHVATGASPTTITFVVTMQRTTGSGVARALAGSYLEITREGDAASMTTA